MSRTLSVVFVATVLLLTSALTAYAECAWVLWEKIMRFDQNRVILNQNNRVAAYETRAQCLDALKAVGEERDGSTDVIVSENLKWQYTCWPDTVEPRGPKGK